MSELASETIDELIAAAEELADRVDGLPERLDAITGRAAGSGIEVTVNLDGRLVGVELDAGALGLGAERLAGELLRLTGQATGLASSAGMALLREVTGIDLSAEAVPVVEEDFSTIETWTLPHSSG